MKRTDTKKALAGKNATELQTELEALLKEQFGLRMQVATQQLTNTSKLKDVRRGIARVRTLLGQAARTSEAAAAKSAPACPREPSCPFRRASPGAARHPSLTVSRSLRSFRCHS